MACGAGLRLLNRTPHRIRFRRHGMSRATAIADRPSPVGLIVAVTNPLGIRIPACINNTGINGYGAPGRNGSHRLAMLRRS